MDAAVGLSTTCPEDKVSGGYAMIPAVVVEDGSVVATERCRWIATKTCRHWLYVEIDGMVDRWWEVFPAARIASGDTLEFNRGSCPVVNQQ